MIILGLGGRNFSQQHVAGTARILSEIAPDYVGALTLCLEDGVYDEFIAKFADPFVPLDDIHVLDELERLVSGFNPKTPVVFRANHPSNVYSLGGTIPADKAKLLSTISGLKSHPELLTPKFMRRF